VVTGHEDPDKSNGSVDWDWVAGSAGTVVVLMGLERLEGICKRLISGGRGVDTPAAAISAGTWPQQQTVVGSLDSLPDLVRRERLQPPATIVIGDVVTFSELAGQAGRPALAEAV
jgi:siroheme synthase